MKIIPLLMSTLILSCAHKELSEKPLIIVKDNNSVLARSIINGDKVKCNILEVNHEIVNPQFKLNFNFSEEKEKQEKIKLCQSVLSYKSSTINGPDFDEIKIDREPNKIVIIGDTGCRLKGEVVQNCLDKNQWPFEKVMESIKKENPQLIIHVGDYLYREKCTDPVACKNLKDTIGYQWTSWKEDFWNPFQSGLGIPLLAARGNHEDCNRAHLGFFYLLSPDLDTNQKCSQVLETQAIEYNDFVIMNIDNSSLTDELLDEKDPNFIFWVKQLTEINEKIKTFSPKPVWLVFHKPVYALTEIKGKTTLINKNLNSIFGRIQLAKNLQLLISGHVHNFQFNHSTMLPPQLVVGNTATSLDVMTSKESKLAMEGENYSFFTPTLHQNEFGYFVISKAENEWHGEYKNINGEVVYNCDLKKGICN